MKTNLMTLQSVKATEDLVLFNIKLIVTVTVIGDATELHWNLTKPNAERATEWIDVTDF